MREILRGEDWENVCQQTKNLYKPEQIILTLQY